MADGYLDAIETPDRMRRGNVMARCRMVVLYDLSAEWNGLVIGTDAIHLVDQADPRDVIAVGLMPDGLALRLYPLDRTEDDNGPVEDAQ